MNMRSQRRIDMLELELFKLRIELDIMHEIMSNVINTQVQAAEARNMDSGKWYPRKNPTQN
jgi:hypothetical protein